MADSFTPEDLTVVTSRSSEPPEVPKRTAAEKGPRLLRETTR
jgi:hypothetical protein